MTGRGLLLPGRAYPHAAPLLALARQALEDHGWAPVPVLWDPAVAGDAVDAGPRAATAFVEGALAGLGGGSGSATVVVGKSLGTRASAYAAQRSWPAVWLTPLLDDEACVAGIRANPAPQLLVGGLRDDFWDAGVAGDLCDSRPGVSVLELEDADHEMVAASGGVRSAENLLALGRALDGWLGLLAGSGSVRVLGPWDVDPAWARIYDWMVEHPVAGGAAFQASLGSPLRLLHDAADEIGRLPDGARVLDVPCGGGVALRGMRVGQDVSYTGVDVSPAMLDRTLAAARRRGLADQVRVRGADVGDLPFDDGSFDLVLSLTGLHCFPDPAAAVAEMVRVRAARGAPGGQHDPRRCRPPVGADAGRRAPRRHPRSRRDQPAADLAARRPRADRRTAGAERGARLLQRREAGLISASGPAWPDPRCPTLSAVSRGCRPLQRATTSEVPGRPGVPEADVTRGTAGPGRAQAWAGFSSVSSNRPKEARTSSSASTRPTQSAPSTDLPGSRSL